MNIGLRIQAGISKSDSGWVRMFENPTNNLKSDEKLFLIFKSD